MKRQVNGHAPALAVKLADHVTPQVAAGGYAMNEQRRAACAASVDVAGRTGPGVQLAAPCVEDFQLAGHVFLPSWQSPGGYGDFEDRQAV